jgi:hypothetical protein
VRTETSMGGMLARLTRRFGAPLASHDRFDDTYLVTP